MQAERDASDGRVKEFEAKERARQALRKAEIGVQTDTECAAAEDRSN